MKTIKLIFGWFFIIAIIIVLLTLLFIYFSVDNFISDEYETELMVLLVVLTVIELIKQERKVKK